MRQRMTADHNDDIYTSKASFTLFSFGRTVATTPHVLFDYAGHLPECPTWSEDESALYWTDIPEQEIHVTIRRAGGIACWRFRKVGCFACVSRADLLRLGASCYLAGRCTDYCSVRFATIPLIRNWRVSTMAALMAMDALCRNVLGARL
ncbi:SMP-30/gluconolactonase/LRE family protein [Salmonella enterica subsp. enterica]|nr:SMP-30/gluconolactonase/LRE family protein [Salmonella enterica subsp. enterica]